ncbi:hypothetical protein D3C72_1471790 [compost metagenome]
MGEIHIAAVRNQAVQLGHGFGHGSAEAGDAGFAAAFDLRPVQLVFLPALQGHVGQQGRWRRLARWRVEVETGHQRHVDDAAAQVGFRFGQLFRVQRTQRHVFIAAADRHADDIHARLARFVQQAIYIAAAEQLAEQHKGVALAEDIFLRDVS